MNGFLKAPFRGGPAYCGQAFPLGRKRRTDAAGIPSRAVAAPYAFLFERERLAAPFFKKGWSSGRGGEQPSFVLENQTVDKLLLEFLESRLHLFIVLDEYGGLAGVVSLEDVLEEMLGREIVDETDAVADLREAARQRRSALAQARSQQNAALKAARAEAAKE